jgi:hypothetical protein
VDAAAVAKAKGQAWGLTNAFVFHCRGENEQGILGERLEDAAFESREEIRAMKMTMAEVVRRKERYEGRVEGKLEGKREDLVKLLSRRFGKVDEEIVARIESESDLSKLDEWFERGIVARTLNLVKIV